MKVSGINNGYSAQFKAIRLNNNEEQLVNRLLKEYIDYASLKVRDEIFYIYDPHLINEARNAAMTDKNLSEMDYLQNLRINLLEKIELYKILPRAFYPESFLTKVMNNTYPEPEDKTIFDNKEMLPLSKLPRKDYKSIKNMPYAEHTEATCKNNNYRAPFYTGIPIVDKFYDYNFNIAAKATDKIENWFSLLHKHKLS